MATIYYCRINGIEIGPMGQDKVERLIKTGRIKGGDAIREGLGGNWLSLAEAKRRAARRRRDRTSLREMETASDPVEIQPLSESLVPTIDSVVEIETPPFEEAEPIQFLAAAQSEIAEHTFTSELAVPVPLPASELGADWSEVSAVNEFVPPMEDTLSESEVADQSRDEALPSELVDSPATRTTTPSLLKNTYLRAAVLVNFIVVPFLVPQFGPTLGTTISIVLAAVSLLIGIAIYWMICLPDSRGRAWGFIAALFIGVFGTSTLIQFEELAVSVAPRDITLPMAPLWLVKLIGIEFMHFMNGVESGSTTNFFRLLVSAVLSAGLCEETLKLIPVAIAIGMGYVRKEADQHGVLYIAAICGIGFGVSEGLWLTLDPHAIGTVTLSSHLTHFLGRAGGHAAFTLVGAAILLWMTRGGTQRSTWRILALTFAAGFIMAIPHGLYDALLICGMSGLAGLLMLSLVWLVLVVSDPGRFEPSERERQRSKDDVPLPMSKPQN